MMRRNFSPGLLLPMLFGIVLVTISLFFWHPAFGVLRVLAGSLFVLIAPGYTWSFFWWQRGSLDGLTRSLFSFGLSIILVPLVAFVSMRFGMRLTVLNTFLVVILVTLAGIALVCSRTRRSHAVSARGEQ